MNNIIAQLNPLQQKAVTRTNGAVLILAGAGSGKTRVITYKIAYLIQKGIEPEKILAVTFTNKAAKEMKQRAMLLIANKNKSPVITTFHSFGYNILKDHLHLLGYRRKFSIYDETDCKKIIKDILKSLNLAESEYDPGQLLYSVNHLKMNQDSDLNDKKIIDIFDQYQKNLKVYNAVDFNDLIKLPIEIFRQFPKVLEKYQSKFHYILVDEYQDTSLMQYTLMKLIAQKHRNISVVGDDDQAIYSWRGANYDNIIRFEKDFAPVEEIRLEQNYRSTANILNAANAVIATNMNRKSKKLWTEETGGDKIVFYEAEDEEKEADFVISTLFDLKYQGHAYHDTAILYRMNSQSRVFEEKLREAEISYKVVGGYKFFERAEIRDILSYMRFLANPNDEVAFHRIINNPKRGIGQSTILKIIEFADNYKLGLYSALTEIIKLKHIKSAKTLSYLEDFYHLIEKYREQIFKPKNIAASVKELVNEIGYVQKLTLDIKNAMQVQFRMNNIDQLIQSVYRYENNPDIFDSNIFDYLQRISLANRENNTDQKDDQLNLMSIHSAKGLEFRVVFLVGTEQGLLPHEKTLLENKTDEEERRLFYVAVTRAREKLFLSFPSQRKRFNQILYREPSDFINEIPRNLLVSANDMQILPDDFNPLAELRKSWKKTDLP